MRFDIQIYDGLVTTLGLAYTRSIPLVVLNNLSTHFAGRCSLRSVSSESSKLRHAAALLTVWAINTHSINLKCTSFVVMAVVSGNAISYARDLAPNLFMVTWTIHSGSLCDTARSDLVLCEGWCSSMAKSMVSIVSLLTEYKIQPVSLIWAFRVRS